MTKVDRYLVIVVGDIEPELHKFETDEQRDNAAIEHKREEGDDDGIFKLDIVDGVPVMMTYSNGFFWDALDGVELDECGDDHERRKK